MPLHAIDPEWYAVIDLGTGREIPAAVGVDEDTGLVRIIVPTHQGPQEITKRYRNGVYVVRRRTAKKLNPHVYGERR